MKTIKEIKNSKKSNVVARCGMNRIEYRLWRFRGCRGWIPLSWSFNREIVTAVRNAYRSNGWCTAVERRWSR